MTLVVFWTYCRQPAPHQQPNVGGHHTAAMPCGPGQEGAPAAPPLEDPPVLPPGRRDQGTLCPGRRLPWPPAGECYRYYGNRMINRHGRAVRYLTTIQKNLNFLLTLKIEKYLDRFFFWGGACEVLDIFVAYGRRNRPEPIIFMRLRTGSYRTS